MNKKGVFGRTTTDLVFELVIYKKIERKVLIKGVWSFLSEEARCELLRRYLFDYLEAEVAIGILVYLRRQAHGVNALEAEKFIVDTLLDVDCMSKLTVFRLADDILREGHIEKSELFKSIWVLLTEEDKEGFLDSYMFARTSAEELRNATFEYYKLMTRNDGFHFMEAQVHGVI